MIRTKKAPPEETIQCSLCPAEVPAVAFVSRRAGNLYICPSCAKIIYQEAAELKTHEINIETVSYLLRKMPKQDRLQLIQLEFDKAQQEINCLEQKLIEAQNRVWTHAEVCAYNRHQPGKIKC